MQCHQYQYLKSYRSYGKKKTLEVRGGGRIDRVKTPVVDATKDVLTYLKTFVQMGSLWSLAMPAKFEIVRVVGRRF